MGQEQSVRKLDKEPRSPPVQRRESFGSLHRPDRCFIFEFHILNKTAAELKMNRCFALYRAALACLCLSAFTLIGCGSSARFVPPGADNSLNTATPIHHVVIVIGENRSFDNLFATYQPPAQGQSVFNLLSEGIVNNRRQPRTQFSAGRAAASDRHSRGRIHAQPPADRLVYHPAPAQHGPEPAVTALQPRVRNTVGAWPFPARPAPVASGRILRALLARPAFKRSNEQWALQHNQFQLRLQSSSTTNLVIAS